MWSGKRCRRAVASSFVDRGGRGARLVLTHLPACALHGAMRQAHDEASARRGECTMRRAVDRASGECGNRLAVIVASVQLRVCLSVRRTADGRWFSGRGIKPRLHQVARATRDNSNGVRPQARRARTAHYLLQLHPTLSLRTRPRPDPRPQPLTPNLGSVGSLEAVGAWSEGEVGLEQECWS